METSDRDASLSRRDALGLLVVPLVAIGAQGLLTACSDSDRSDSGHAGSGGNGEDAGSGGSGEHTGSGGNGGEAPVDTSGIPWASGGTKAMKGNYPDPFTSNPGTACVLTKAMILGPCYAATVEREDVSEGVPGVPMRLSLLVVSADGCTPVVGATVDIWHTSTGGVYSEFGPGTACNPGADDQSALTFCRGVQTTNSSGRVDFSSVVPGWYRGRAVHIHFTVRLNEQEFVTGQFFLEDSLLDDIEQQVDYEERGTRDTRNTQDGVLPASDPSPYILNTAKRADGVLHAWKIIGIRSSLSEELPSAGGSLGVPGDGGFPGGGFPSGGFPSGGFPGFGDPSADGGTGGAL
jgi:protocatechuate 3,4-dioxygenase beta subunit